jgi:hypothetical protein
MSNKPKHSKCPHALDFTQEEEEGITWLQSTLNKISASSLPEASKAHAAHLAVGKLFNKAHELHDYAHGCDQDLEEAEMLVVGMAQSTKLTGKVKDGDMN